jgi:hypothetical protein
MYQMAISCESPNPQVLDVTGAKNGTISTPVGCTIPLLIN